MTARAAAFLICVALTFGEARASARPAPHARDAAHAAPVPHASFAVTIERTTTGRAKMSSWTNLPLRRNGTLATRARPAPSAAVTAKHP